MKTAILVVALAAALSACDEAPQSKAPQPVAQAPEPVISHNYVLREKGQYGYEAAISADAQNKGQVAQQIVMFRYSGQQGGTHQVFAQEGNVYTAMECEKPCGFIKIMSFYGDRHLKTERIRGNTGSLAQAVLEDAVAGELEQARVSFGKAGPFNVWFDEKLGMLKTRAQ